MSLLSYAETTRIGELPEQFGVVPFHFAVDKHSRAADPDSRKPVVQLNVTMLR